MLDCGLANIIHERGDVIEGMHSNVMFCEDLLNFCAVCPHRSSSENLAMTTVLPEFWISRLIESLPL